MSLSLTQEQDGSLTPEHPGLATHKWIKDLYFQYRRREVTLNITKEIEEAMTEYIEIVEQYQDKRNWDGAEQQLKNTKQFINEMI